MGSFRSNSRGGYGGRSSGSGFGGRSEGRGGFQRRPSNDRFEERPRRRDDFEDRGDSRRSERRPPLEMHDVVCAKCGKDCQVPFKPTTDKPVFCSDCFKKNDSPRNDRGSGSGITPEQFKQLNVKLDKILEILEAVTEVEEDVEDDEESEEDKKE